MAFTATGPCEALALPPVVLGELIVAVHTLETSVGDLRTATDEDRPDLDDSRGGSKPITDLIQVVEDLADAVHLASSAVAPAPKLNPGADANAGLVIATAEAVWRSGRLLCADLLAVDGTYHLARSGSRGWGRVWHAWATVVHEYLLDVRRDQTRAEQASMAAIQALLGGGPWNLQAVDTEEGTTP